LEKYSSEYWNQRYIENKAGWDIGYVSPPIKSYIDQLADRSIRILVPGAGNAYEVEYLYKQGFHNTYLLDFSEKSIENFLKRCPGFPQDHIFKEDFFTHQGHYDLIIEQTFFSSIPPEKRYDFAEQVFHLLKKGGKFVGLIFKHHFPFEGPPFGGTPSEYKSLFGKWLSIDIMETSINSIKPRFGREIFVKLRKAD